MTIPELAKEIAENLLDADNDRETIELVLYRWLSEVTVHPQRWLRLLVQAAEFHGRAVATDGDLEEVGELLMDTIDHITALPKSGLQSPPPSPGMSA